MDSNLSTQINFSDDSNLDIKRYISLYISNWYWFTIAIFIALCLAYGINRYSEETYTVSATMLIKDALVGGGQANMENVIPGGDIFKSQQNLRNEIGILKSYNLNYRVMKELNDFKIVYVGVGRRGIVESKLYKLCPFIVVFDTIRNEQIGVRINIKILSKSKYLLEINSGRNYKKEMNFGEKFCDMGFDFFVNLRDTKNFVYDKEASNSYYFYFTNPIDLANEYRGKLNVTPIEKEASLVTLTVSGYVAQQESDYLNKLMDNYLKYGLEIKKGTADSTIKFIDNQLKVVSDSLILAEDKLQQFRKSNRFVDINTEGSFIMNKMEKYESEKATYALQMQYYNYLLDYLNRNNNESEILSPSLFGISDQGLIKLINDQSGLLKEKKRLSLNIDGNQPALTFLAAQESETRQTLIINIKNGIENINLALKEINGKIADQEVEINKLPSTERELISIKRKFDLNNTVYTYLLEKRAESGIARASTVSDNRIIDYASEFRAARIKPRVRNNYLIAIIIGLAFPMIIISVIDYFNDRVMDKGDIVNKTKVPIIGYISHGEGKNEIIVVEKPGSSLAESFRAIRTAMKYFVKEDEVPVIAISSTISSEGKTFMAVNLSAIISMLGKKVLLVGLDLRKPRINKIFEFENSNGMSTYLSGNCEYEEIIRKTQVDNLYYAASGPIPPNPAELIETDLMKKFIERAKKEFDYIIFDTPPVAIVTDALLLASHVNINLFIVRQRYSSRNTLEMIEQLNNEGKLKNMAIIINDISLSGYYGYGMRYGYSIGYDYSYGFNYYSKIYYGKYGYSEKAKGYYSEES